MIKLQIIGHLGKDAASNSVGGKNVINFSVAHSEKYKDRNGDMVNKTTWVECSYWTEKTGILPYLKKGTSVYCEGTPEVRTYEKNDGTFGTSLTLRVSSINLLSANSQQQQSTASAPQSHGSVASDISEPMDDLPF